MQRGAAQRGAAQRGAARTTRSISSVVTPGRTAACALSSTSRASVHAARRPLISAAVLMGTARRGAPRVSRRSSARLGASAACRRRLPPGRGAPMRCCLFSSSLVGVAVSA